MVAEDFTLSTCDVRWPVAYSQGFAQIRITLPVPTPRSPTAEEIAPPITCDAASEPCNVD